jgi:hypothetical protein
MRSARFAACAVAAFTLVATPSRADPTKAECVEANTQAQKLRRESKLAAARHELETCSIASCPAMVRSDCTARLDELQKAQPTLVLDIKNGKGDDLTDVKVTVDGQPFPVTLDGTAVPIDPGQHLFIFEATGFEPASKTLVIKEAEKDRRERIVMRRTASGTGESSSATSGATTLPDEPAVDTEQTQGLGTQRWLGVIAGGVGVAGVAVGSIFGLMASSEWNAQKSACASPSDCPDHQGALTHHSNLTTDGTISTWTFIAGGALVASGALLFLTAPSRSGRPSSGLVVVPAAGPRSVALDLAARFW